MKKLLKLLKIPAYHRVAFIDTLVILVFTIMPTIFIVFNGLRKGGEIDIKQTYIAGEFFIYSISLLSSAYLVFNQFKAKVSDWKSGSNKFIIILLPLISGFYTIVNSNHDSDSTFVKWSSIISFTLCFFLFYNSQIIANKNSPDIAEERREEQQVIEDALN